MQNKLNYDEVIHRGNRVVEDARKQRKYLQGIKTARNLRNGFFGILAILIVLVIGYFVYSKKDEAVRFIQDKTASILQKSQSPSPAAVAPVPTNCDNLVITDATKSSDGKPHISPVTIGKCYNIGEADRDFWKKVFSTDNQVAKYAAHIYSESSDHQLSQEEVAKAITQSLSTNILDLRKIQPVLPTAPSEPTLTPTTAFTSTPAATATPEPTATPSATATPSVLVVPFPEKERHLDLAGLVETMKSHNIQAVASNNTAADFHDRVNWMVWYQTGNGKDYLILNTLNSQLPPSCATATFLSISLQNTGASDEVAAKVGASQVWIVCK